MAIQMTDNMIIQGKKPDVERQLFLLKSDFKKYPEFYLPDVYIASCVEDGNIYVYRRTEEDDPEIGRWRPLSSDGGSLSPEDEAKIQKIGDWTDIELEAVTTIVEALNKLNSELLGGFTVVGKTLNVLDKNNNIIQTLDLTTVASVLDFEDLKNVTITDVKDKQRLVYDASTTAWVNADDDILPAAKQYTDDEIAKLDRRSVIPVDAKPSQEDAELDTIYVYPVDETWFQTIYLAKGDEIKEITEKYLGSPNFDDYVHKENDSVDTYAETYSDESKFPKVKLIAELQADMNEKIGKKVNTEDIVDDLESTDVDKPLSANQGAELKKLIEESAGGIFEEEEGTTATIGGLSAGTVIKDWSDHKVLQKILFPYIKPEAKLTISPTTVLYKIGEAVSGLVLSCLATKHSEPITSIKFFRGSTELEEITDDVASGGTFTHNVADDITSNTTFKATVSDGTSSADSSVTIKFVNPVFYGCSKAVLSEKLQEKGKITYDNITCVNDSVVVKYDATWGNLKSILDASSFESLGAFTKSQEVIGGTTYNVYTLTIPATLSGFKYTFSF